MQCHPEARLGGGNIIDGRLVLDRNTTFAGRNTIMQFGSVEVSENSTIGALNTFAGRNVLGENSHIGSDSLIQSFISERNVTIGSNNTLFGGSFGQNTIIGNNNKIFNRLVLEDNAIIGDNTLIGVFVKVNAGTRVGDNSCIGTDACVTKDVPPNSILNRGEEPRPITPGATVKHVLGNCVEIISPSPPRTAANAAVGPAVAAAIPVLPPSSLH